MHFTHLGFFNLKIRAIVCFSIICRVKSSIQLLTINIVGSYASRLWLLETSKYIACFFFLLYHRVKPMSATASFIYFEIITMHAGFATMLGTKIREIGFA